MTQFIIEQDTEQPDRIYVEVDRRIGLAIIRTEAGIEIRIYPRTEGLLWDEPYDKFTVDQEEIDDLEKEMEIEKNATSKKE